MKKRELHSLLSRAIRPYSMLEHPFYQAWSAGRLSLDELCGYAREYYVHVRAFPTYLSLVHAGLDDPELRQVVLRNLVEEDLGADGVPDHLTLWLDFAEGLGLDRERVRQNPGLIGVRQAVAKFRGLSARSPLSGLAALYAYESQIPEVSAAKLEGLREYFGITDPKTTAYFRVHQEADIRHREEELELIASLIQTPEDAAEAERAAEEGAEAAWSLLSAICQAFCPHLMEETGQGARA